MTLQNGEDRLFGHFLKKMIWKGFGGINYLVWKIAWKSETFQCNGK